MSRGSPTIFIINNRNIDVRGISGIPNVRRSISDLLLRSDGDGHMKTMKKNQITAGLLLMVVMLPFPLLQILSGIGSAPSNESITSWIIFSAVCSALLMVIINTTDTLKGRNDQY